MIPVQLVIKNFLPYRAPDPVRFEGIHLACLTGQNGAGKSSILDAITWALWGKSRTASDDDLVHLGQSEMSVQLDFEQEGQLYRVIRLRAIGKRGRSELHFYVLREDGAPTTMTEPSIRQTQAKIDEILRLDYSTFVHSAYLQQGKADAFTTQQPARRKKILSDILGLDRWTTYEEAAKDKQRELKSRIDYLDQAIDEISRELARKPALQADLKAAEQSHKEAESARIDAENRLKEVEHAPHDLRAAGDRKRETETRLKERQRELDETNASIEQYQEQIENYQQIVDSRSEIEEGYATLQSARETSSDMTDKLRQLQTLSDDRSGFERKLATAEAALNGEIKSITERITELEEIIQVDYSAELETVQAQISILQEKELERDSLDSQVSDLRETIAGLKSQKDNITVTGKELRDRLERLTAAPDDAALCPLCAQPLKPEARAVLIRDIEAEVETRREDYRKTEEQIAALGVDLKGIQVQIKTTNTELRDLKPLLEQAGTLRTQAQNVVEANTRLDEDHKRLGELQAQLDHEDFALDIREQLAVLNTQQDALGYDEDTHDDAQQQLKANNRYEELNMRLKMAIEQLPALETRLGGEQKRRERLGKNCEEIQAEITQVESEIAELTALVKEYETRDREVAVQRTNERSAQQRLTIAQQELDALDKKAARKTEHEENRQQARHQEGIYGELARAFGKNGIPAMIIETAIPELETTANTLLAKMTDGRMSLRLPTQREKKTGGIAETLDIEIADELGTRDYELYSGGEAFRINFAIRVALSQMLARRAGAHLRTLFIDEGFGTQDDAGRSKLVEAINAIQDEFDMILVITHIDDLRDSFPVHIMVDKTSNGSRITVQ